MLLSKGKIKAYSQVDTIDNMILRCLIGFILICLYNQKLHTDNYLYLFSIVLSDWKIY